MDLQSISACIISEYNDITATADKIKEKINIVYRDLAKLFTIDTLEEDTTLSTIAGQEIYVVSKDSRETRDIYLTNGETDRVRLRRINSLARLWPRSTGMPKRWFPYGMGNISDDVKQQFGLDPVPTETEVGLTLTVAYEPMPADLFEDEDKIKYIPEEKQYLIVWGAVGILAGIEEDYDIAQNFESRYRTAYNELMMEMGLFRESNYPAAAKQVKQP